MMPAAACYIGFVSYLEHLNEAQRQAVEHTDGPLLILAGAGAGKTRVITYRILHLVLQGVAPEEILAVTFTNKAAREMRERAATLIRESAELNRPIASTGAPFVSTFHALGVHILKENARLLRIPRHFAIYDRSDSMRAIKDAIKEAGFDVKTFEPRKLLGAISRQKGKGVSCRAFAEGADRDYFSSVLSDVWERYEAALARDKALDFDDLLLRAVELLREYPDVLARYQNTWRYIHVDEYQDTNSVQYEFARLLAAKHQNICVVGDIDQNIYSWRGADINNILDFERHYPDATIILLEENYRSTQVILSASNDIIKKNVKRKEKTLYTKNEEGERIVLYGAYDEGDEARFIIERVQELIRDGISAREIAVFYRANFQSRAIEEAFLYANIPYQVLGTKFFDRKEVKDTISFLRAALNPESLADLKRIVNVPPRGIGKVTFLKIAEGRVDTLAPSMRERVERFFADLREIRNAIETKKPSEAVQFAVRKSGLEEYLSNSKSDEDLERLENVKELATLATKYDALDAPEGIEKLLEEAALATDQDALERNEDAVKLMTVHASKGLEFDYVFITGLEEGLFPHEVVNPSEDRDDEEERRLFYVALTRARKRLFLSFASVRTIFGSEQVNLPSQFITDIDDVYLEAAEGEAPLERTVYLDD